MTKDNKHTGEWLPVPAAFRPRPTMDPILPEPALEECEAIQASFPGSGPQVPSLTRELLNLRALQIDHATVNRLQQGLDKCRPSGISVDARRYPMDWRMAVDVNQLMLGAPRKGVAR